MDADQLRGLWAKQAHEHYADDRQDAAEMYIEALRLLGDDSTTRYARSVIALRAAFYRDLLADIDRTAGPDLTAPTEGPSEMPETTTELHLVTADCEADPCAPLAAFTTRDAAQAWADAYNLAEIANHGRCDQPAYVDSNTIDVNPAPPTRDAS